MKDLCSKKAIAASLSLTLALGSVPAVALADDAMRIARELLPSSLPRPSFRFRQMVDSSLMAALE